MKKELSKHTKECFDLMELLLNVGLERIVLNLRPYYPQLDREIIVNLTSKFVDPPCPRLVGVLLPRGVLDFF